MTAVSTTGGNGAVAGSQDDQQAAKPWKYEFRSSKGFVIAVVSIAIFADVFIYGMVIPLIPAILRDRLQMPDFELQKWMSILLAVFGGATLIGSPILGFLADKGTSRKIPFVFGLLAVAGSTVMFWTASSPAPLVIARLLQGLSTAAVWIVGNALIIDTMGKDQLGTAMGYVSMAVTIGTLAGPALGGVMLDQVGYDAVFILAISVIGVDIILRLLMIEPTRAAKLQEADVEGSEPLLGHSDNRGYQATENPERTVDEFESNKQRATRSSIPPILRLAMSGQLLVVLIASVVDSIIYNMFESVLPVFVIRTFHWTSFGIGMCFFALSIPSLLSPVVGYFVDRYGPRIASFLGFVLLVPVLVVFQFVTDDSLNSRILFFVLLCVAGISFTAQLVALMVEVSEPVERKERECPGIFGEKGAVAQAYALHNMSWACGQMVGPILSGGLAETAGWTVLVVVLAAFCGATAILLACTNEKISRLLWKKSRTVREETRAN